MTISSAGLPRWLEERKLTDQRTFAELQMPDSNSMEVKEGKIGSRGIGDPEGVRHDDRDEVATLSR